MTKGYHTTFDYLDQTRVSLNKFDTIIEKLLIALLVFMPLALGARAAWSEEVVIALSGAIVICFLLKFVYHCEQKLIWTWAYVPIGVFLLIAIFQLISFPVDLLSIISPNTTALKTELLGDLPNLPPDTPTLKSMTLSFYPNATKHNLRLVLAVVAVFIVVLNVFHRPSQIKRLLLAIALIGGIIAMFALIQDIFGNGKVYWIVSTPHKAYSGPFTNHSHYGQFMNLSIGAAFGYLCVKLHEDFIGRKITLPVVSNYFSSPSAKQLWRLIAIISLGAVTVFVSLTRSGMVSMFIATAFTTLLLSRRRSLKGYGWLMVVMALAAFICILYIGFDAVYDRLATLSVLDNYKVRWQIIKDLTVSYRHFPILGTGLGTHSVVYPMFQNINTTRLFTHAENEYAQVTEETGLIGLVSLIIFGIIIWSNYVRNIRNDKLPICSAAYGLGFGLLAILIHSLSDFGQHVPANAFLSAISCALLVVLARQGGKQNFATQTVTSSRKWTHSKVLRLGALFTISGITAWSIIGANNARIAEHYWAKVLSIEKGLVERNWQGTDAEYTDLISYAAAATEHQPENVQYRYWLNVYRWYNINRTIDANTGFLPEDSISSVRNIADEFHKARTYCPTFGATYCTLGQIEKLILDDEVGGAKKIRKGFRLAPSDPIACLAAGCLDIEEGEIEQSFEKLKKAILLNGKLFKGIVDIYIKIDRPDLAVAIAGDNTFRLSHVVTTLNDTEEYKDIVEKTQTKVKDLLEAKCQASDAPVWALASLANIYRKENDNEKAIKYYRRALALDYGQVNWRLTLARLLAEMERIPEAMREARICLRLRPQLKAAEKLIADLSVHPKMINRENPTP